jgi:delta 1-pyrroline-5-carboxylate dehydrogenase
MVVDTFRYYAGAPSGCSATRSRGGRRGHDRPRALGVVALITPWNFPLTIAAWKLAPALARATRRAQARRAHAADGPEFERIALEAGCRRAS